MKYFLSLFVLVLFTASLSAGSLPLKGDTSVILNQSTYFNTLHLYAKKVRDNGWDDSYFLYPKKLKQGSLKEVMEYKWKRVTPYNTTTYRDTTLGLRIKKSHMNTSSNPTSAAHKFLKATFLVKSLRKDFAKMLNIILKREQYIKAVYWTYLDFGYSGEEAAIIFVGKDNVAFGWEMRDRND